MPFGGGGIIRDCPFNVYGCTLNSAHQQDKINPGMLPFTSSRVNFASPAFPIITQLSPS